MKIKLRATADSHPPTRRWVERAGRTVLQGCRVPVAFAVIVSITLVLSAHAQDKFPSKPVRIVVPFTAGGPGDIVARILAVPLAENLGQPVVVENRPGGDAIPGTEYVMKSPADGYTILQYTTAQGLNMVMKEGLRYDLMRDFMPIARSMQANMVFLTGASSPYKSVADLVAAAKTKAGGLTFGSGSTGSVGHLSSELFKRAAGISAVHAPYKGNASLLPDLVAGRIDYYFGTQAEAVPNVKGGHLRALAVTTAQRVPTFPDVPTMIELGYKGFDPSLNYGYFAPANTPVPIVKQLQEAFLKSLASPRVLERLQTLGVTATPGSGEDLLATVKAELLVWGQLIKTGNIRSE